MIHLKSRLFFDNPAVLRAVSRARRRVLSRSGGTVRMIARRSIRQRKKVSQPGQPPSSHTRRLKDNIFYAYDAAKETVVIGPVPFRSRRTLTAGAAALEHGGAVTVKERRQRKRIRIRARPFMGPALEKAAPRIAQFWQNAVR